MKNKNWSTKTIIAPLCALLLLLSAPRTLSAATIGGQEYNSAATALGIVTLAAIGTFIQYTLDKNGTRFPPIMAPMSIGMALILANVKQTSNWESNVLMACFEICFGCMIGIAVLGKFRKQQCGQWQCEEQEACTGSSASDVCIVPAAEDAQEDQQTATQ